MLCLCARVEAQDEVVALVVFGALFPCRLREEEGTPVRYTANNAAGGEDDVSRCSSDSNAGLDEEG